MPLSNQKELFTSSRNILAEADPRDGDGDGRTKPGDDDDNIGCGCNSSKKIKSPKQYK